MHASADSNQPEGGSPADRRGDDEVEDRAGSRKGRLRRLQEGVVTGSEAEGSDFVSKWNLDKMELREKQFSFAAAGGAALFAMSIFLADVSNPKYHTPPGQPTPQTYLIVGLVCAALVLVATIVGRRAPAGFALLITGVAFLGFLFLGVIFLALAVWLLYRSYKIQRGAPVAPPPGSRGGGPRRSGEREGRSDAPRKAPTANKRYSPKTRPGTARRPSS